MRKGFALTLMMLMLLLLMIEMATLLRPYRQIESGQASGMAAQKVVYAHDDIAEGVISVLNITIVQNATNLTIYDHLPGNANLPSSLAGYEAFVRRYYATPEMNITFLDAGGNPANLSALSPRIIILPYNIWYEYEDFGKRVVRSSCSGGPCNISNVTRIDLVYNLTGMAFVWTPVLGNLTHYNWAPDNLDDCEPINGDPMCMNFSLTVRDMFGQTFACPSAMCNHSTFPTDNKSTLDIAAVPCWFEISLGDDELYEVRVHSPGNPDSPCDANVDTQTSYEMPSATYYISYPTGLRVHEMNFNLSVTRNVTQ